MLQDIKGIGNSAPYAGIFSVMMVAIPILRVAIKNTHNGIRARFSLQTVPYHQE